ncbi:hypothetical protein [Pseudomonas nitroreducens]|uniref:hypothetical protein n=1 Tax=Pseudomonas nitroreducens TaxID=46680 RepID=UPI00147FF5EF|nr:hypothetical protein [Pseudomonas nitroreducens]NNN28145.1 hypothetical protein [Pseudomonas nitroreducens]
MKHTAIEIKTLNPITTLTYGAGLFFILWCIAPINFIFQGGTKSITVILLCSTLLALGIVMGARSYKNHDLTLYIDPQRLKKSTNYIFILGLLGMVLRAFERIYLRAGGNISSNFAENRELISTGGNGSLALISALLASTLILLPTLILLSKKCGIHRRANYVFALASLTYPLFDTLYQGSRSTLVIYLSTLLISTLTTKSINPKKVKSIILTTTVLIPGLLLAFGLSTYIFIERASQYGIDPISSMQISGYAKFAPASDATLSLIRESGISGISALVYSLVNFCQYFLHGLYEFFYLAENTSSATTYGMIDFYIPAKILSSALGFNNIEETIASGILRPGVYTTFFGPLVYDFGPIFCIPACLAVGLFFGSYYRRLRRGAPQNLPLIIIINSFLAFSFVVNLFSSGAGQYLIISSIAISTIISRMKIFNTSPTSDLHSTKRTKI